MTFREKLAQDAQNVFLNTAHFAETVSYTPSGGSPKSISAAILRNRREVMDQTRGSLAGEDCEILIQNDATNGVTSVTDSGASPDTVSFPVEYGGTAVTWRVLQIINVDDGMWHLRVRK